MNKLENKMLEGYDLLNLTPAPIKELAELSRIAAADGAVLLKNDNSLLPLEKGTKVSVFGRIQSTYYKSGTGSGGMVNVEYVTNILDELRKSEDVEVNEELANVYAKWIEENPFYYGVGWASEPWCQQEMPIDENVVKKAADSSDVAIIVIGRTAGEDKDNSLSEGSLLLTATERDMMSKVCSIFDKVVVLLNVGNVIDMGFINDYKFDSLLYLWQGGQEGGAAAADLITGKVTPSGKLADTVSLSANDYPSTPNFGSDVENKYCEDIYVGYRYFETVAKDKVLYPFGFGLSYTTFERTIESAKEENGIITVEVKVTNSGKYDGKDVVECYYGAPQGKLGQPLKQLVAFKKTKLLAPNESQLLTVSFKVVDMASYDDSGVTGNKSCYVLEKGEYNIFVGDSVRSAKCSFTYTVDELKVVSRLTEALAPTKDFERMHPVLENGSYVMKYEPAPKRTVDLTKRIEENRPKDIEQTGNKGILLIDVKSGKATMEEFIAQLSDYDLACISKGEGMNSPKVTPGTGSAFGGVTDTLIDLGIPVACTTDGPSGIRMDSGAKATAMPNGTCLACTWDDELIEQLYVYEGIEMRSYNIDALLGPGMNIHRHPLNGRNFEYFSEDPLLTGKMAAAISRGIHKAGPTSTIKHFIGNNQEIGRSKADSVMSERAAREIYLKAFKIAVDEGGATSIMSTYGPVNGYWTMGNYDLLTTILRNEWGYTGFVMSDWWAVANIVGEEPIPNNLKQMVRAQNDVFMVCSSSVDLKDNILEGLESGFITRGELQRNAMNICRYIMNSPVFDRYIQNGCKIEKISVEDDSVADVFHEIENVESGKEYVFNNPAEGRVFFVVEMSSTASELSQMSINIAIDGKDEFTLSLKGTNGKVVTEKRSLYMHPYDHTIKLTFDGIANVEKVTLKR